MSQDSESSSVDYNLLRKQADTIAEHILYEANPENGFDLNEAILKRFRIERLRLAFREGRGGWVEGRRVQIKDHYLDFLAQIHPAEFKEVLEACRDDEDTFSSRGMNVLVGFMGKEKRDEVVRFLGLNFDPVASAEEAAAQFFNEGIGRGLEEFLRSRYGFDMREDPIDMADLLHAAFFDRFAEVAGCHMVPKEIANYLSSSGRSGKKGVFDPDLPSLDSIVAFFNSYDDKKVIENILFDIEARRIFDFLTEETRPYLTNPEEYRVILDVCLEDVINNLKRQEAEGELEGSKRILGRLLGKYEGLRNFSVEGIPEEVNGGVFPRFYQAEAILEIYRNKRFLIADEMGTGKTAIAVLASEYIAQQRQNPDFRTLVVTTTTNKNEFQNKIKTYLRMSDEEAAGAIVAINGGDRKEQYQRAKSARYVVINYELLRAKDWRLEDYYDWEVDEEKYEVLRAELYRAFRNSRWEVSEFEFIMGRIPKRIRGKIMGSVKTPEDAYDACIKIIDLDEAQSVYNNLIAKNGFDHVIVDEVQNGKRETSLTARAILGVTEGVEYVSCLSGTPFVNGLSDLSIIFNITDVYGELLAASEEKVGRLEERLGVEGDPELEEALSKKESDLLKRERVSLKRLKSSIENGDVKRILLDNPRMIRDYLRPKMVRRRSQKVLNIPDIHFVPEVNGGEPNLEEFILLPMFPRMAYEILQAHDFKNCADQLRALQMFLLSGGLYASNFTPAKTPGGGVVGVQPQMPPKIEGCFANEESRKYEWLERKIEAIALDESRRKRNVVVFSSLYKTNVTQYLEGRLKQRFPGLEILRVDGDVIDKNNKLARTEVIRKFNSSEKPAVLVATLPTMKEAIELNEKCSNVIFLDLPFTWSEFAQGYSRVWRGDQDEPVTVHNFLVENSLDIGKLRLLQSKRRLGELLLQGSPPTKEEMEILELSDADMKSYFGFIERYIRETTVSSMKIMRDLYGAGREKSEQFLGEKSRRSVCYADAYILNTMSEGCLLGIMKEMRGLGLFDLENLGSLDDKVLDLAAGYGKFAHMTGIKTENLEINPVMIERAADFCPAANYTQGVMQDVNAVYGDDRFECVIYSLAFHYTSADERGQMLHDIHKTLKDGGYLFLTESLASIDEEGRQKVVEVMRHTGYDIIKTGVEKVGGKNFYMVVARKKRDAKLYESSFALRTFEDEVPEEYDPNCMEESREDLKTRYAPRAGDETEMCLRPELGLREALDSLEGEE